MIKDKREGVIRQITTNHQGHRSSLFAMHVSLWLTRTALWLRVAMNRLIQFDDSWCRSPQPTMVKSSFVSQVFVIAISALFSEQGCPC